MAEWSSLPCVDAGTEYCPCYLAELGRCVNCSLLAGLDQCDCAWTGSCAYAEFNWNNRSPAERRNSLPCRLINRTRISANTFVMSLATPKWLSRRLITPGSFVFIRPEGRPTFFEVPLSAMHISGDSSSVSFAVQVVGPKTTLLEQEKASFVVRGPFYSGILGLQHLKAPSAHALIVAKGVSQGRALHTANYLTQKGSEVTILAGPGSCGQLFLREWGLNDSVKVVEMARKPDHNRSDIQSTLASFAWDLIMSAGPDIQHRMIREICREQKPSIRLCFTNNALMCCGEGICGACESEDIGLVVRTCKSMPDTERFTL